jgi:hypothetical protein
MKITRQSIVLFFVIVAILGSWLAPLDLPATQQVDAGLKRALVSFATARALNAVISVAQGTQASIQPLGVGVTLAPGQALDPVNDLVEKFSNLMLAASVIFGVQKVLISIGSYWPLSLALTLVALGWMGCYLKIRHPPDLLSRLLVILLMLRFAVPVVTIGTDQLWQKYLAHDYAVSQKTISSVSGQVKELNLVKPGQATDPDFMEKTKQWFSQKIDVSVYFQGLTAVAEQAIEHLIKLIVIFTLQTLVIPSLLLWALYSVTRRVFERHKSPSL